MARYAPDATVHDLQRVKIHLRREYTQFFSTLRPLETSYRALRGEIHALCTHYQLVDYKGNIIRQLFGFNELFIDRIVFTAITDLNIKMIFNKLQKKILID